MSFPKAASVSLRDSQLRRNLAKATGTIRAKRASVVGEVPDWAELREAGRALKDSALASLDSQLERLEAAVTDAGGRVHWARDGAEANRIVCEIARAQGVDEVVKVKSIVTDEIKLNEALADAGVRAIETDLAELIIQLGHDKQSHILVPAIHKNRAEIREVFARELGLPDLTDDPPALTEAARLHLRAKFLSARMGISGANFAVAETGTVSVFESEGNGRMCTTLPDVLVTVMGIEKLVPAWRDMEVFIQLLPRSSTGERMNPYTSFWTGVSAGDGPQEFHLVLLDNGRSRILKDAVAREALLCIRCGACMNTCPIYNQVGGYAYGAVYQGPIGSMLTPLLLGTKTAGGLAFASTLCGACAELCPVMIPIPEILLHLRRRVVEGDSFEGASVPGTLRAVARVGRMVLGSPALYRLGGRLARTLQAPWRRGDWLPALPPPLDRWTMSRPFPAFRGDFRAWWKTRKAAARRTEGGGSHG